MDVREAARREFRLLLQTARAAWDDKARDLASAIAFWTFFSLFPLLMVVLAVAGRVVGSLDLQARIGEIAGDMLAGSAPLVRESLESAVRHRGAMTGVGLVGLLWAASRGFGAVSRAVDRTIGVTRARFYQLPGIRGVLMAVAVAIVMVVSIGATVAVEVVLEPPVLERFGLGPIGVPHPPVWALGFALAFLGFGLVYKLAPAVHVRWRQALPGALLAALLFELGKAAFVLYLDRIARFEAVYGSLASIIVLLLWLYVSAFILVIGAEYNLARLGRRTTGALPPT